MIVTCSDPVSDRPPQNGISTPLTPVFMSEPLHNRLRETSNREGIIYKFSAFATLKVTTGDCRPAARHTDHNMVWKNDRLAETVTEFANLALPPGLVRQSPKTAHNVFLAARAHRALHHEGMEAATRRITEVLWLCRPHDKKNVVFKLLSIQTNGVAHELFLRIDPGRPARHPTPGKASEKWHLSSLQPGAPEKILHSGRGTPEK